MIALPSRLFAPLILLASAAALAAALVAQFAFGLVPCPLCLYQRVPYDVAAVAALTAIAVPRSAVWLLALCAVAGLAGAGIAAFHVGVEQHWWVGLASCSGGAPQATSVEALKAMLAGPPAPRCDDVQWSLFGISMAGYNVLYAAFLAGFSGWAAAQRLKEIRP